ncbi:transposase, MuDR, MULE transposase domain protein [Tanacetum coccineum]
MGKVLQHLPYSPATNQSYPGRLVAGDPFPGRHVAREKLNGKARWGYVPGRHCRAHKVSAKLISATVESFPGRHWWFSSGGVAVVVLWWWFCCVGGSAGCGDNSFLVNMENYNDPPCVLIEHLELKDANPKRWDRFYASLRDPIRRPAKYTLSGFTWAFKGAEPIRRLRADAFEAKAECISYQQAWRGKEYGLEKIRGSPYESFEMLPYYLHNLERKNKGTVTRIKIDEGVFEMLFIALGASIRKFVNHLRPLLIIDAAHLKGQYKGTNLVAVGMDGKNQIVPITFGICKGETGPCWSWWMSVLKECIGDNPNLLFISNKHASIALAVRNEFPLAFHAVSEEFRSNMDILQTVQLDAYHKLMEVGPQRWSRAHCPLIRYNYMTSNSVESVNACSVLNRKLPITMLTETYHEMLQKWYFERREVAANMKHEITDWVADKVHKRKLKSALWVVNGIDPNLYQVYDGGHNREVNLMSRSCQCRKWQLSGIPCGHVIAVTRFLGLTDCVQFVADWFKKEKYQGTYAESIHFVGDMHEWELPSHIHPAIPPRMDNPQPGRPKNTNRILSQGEEPRSIYCSRCHQAGYKRD